MSSDIIIIDDKPASAQAANLFEMGRANSKNKGARTAPLESDYASNGSRRIIVSVRSGPVEMISTGTPVSSSIRWM